jgi:hypothetical protein
MLARARILPWHGSLPVHSQFPEAFLVYNEHTLVSVKGANMADESTRTEEFRVSGEKMMTKVKELLQQGNIRRIVIKNEDGRPLIDLPLTWGVVGTIVAPQLAALGAIAALVTHGTIVVEKVGSAVPEAAPEES